MDHTPRNANAGIPGGSWRDRYAVLTRITDALVVAGAVSVAQYVRFGSASVDLGIPESRHYFYSAALIVLWLAALEIFQTRHGRVLGSGVAEYRRVIAATFWIFGFIAIASLVLKLGPSRIYLAVALPLGSVTLLLSRWLWRNLILRRRRRGECQDSLVVIGDRDFTSEFIRRLNRTKDNAYRVLGVGLYGHDGREDYLDVDGQRVPILGNDEYALENLDGCGATSVALAGVERMGHLRVRHLLTDLEHRNIHLLVSPTASPLTVEPVPGYPLIELKSPQYSAPKNNYQRIFDVGIAVIALLLSSPVLLLAAVAIKLTTRGAIIHREERVGLGGTSFQLIKLRTTASGPENTLGFRAAGLGQAIRQMSVDEIPMFINVLKGDMSVIGPRPLTASAVRDLPGSARRTLPRPGISSLTTQRLLDLGITLLALPLWLPVLVVVGLVKFAIDGSPLLYLSKRVGRAERSFTVYKFRTMVDDPEYIKNEISKLAKVGFEAIPIDSPVYTRAGRIFERLQLVELPQLLNVLKGDMSLVGYRPLPSGHVSELQQTFGRERVADRHNHTPGITGLAQLSGKVKLNNAERLAIEIAEAEFFSSCSRRKCVEAYFAILSATIQYVAFGSNENALRLRDKYLYEYLYETTPTPETCDAAGGNTSPSDAEKALAGPERELPKPGETAALSAAQSHLGPVDRTIGSPACYPALEPRLAVRQTELPGQATSAR